MANISTSTNTINRSIQTRKRMLNTPTIQEYLIVRAITPAASNTAPGTEKNKPSNEGLSGTAFRSIPTQIGRASCRERVCQYVSILVVSVSLKNKNNSIIVKVIDNEKQIQIKN